MDNKYDCIRRVLGKWLCGVAYPLYSLANHEVLIRFCELLSMLSSRRKSAVAPFIQKKQTVAASLRHSFGSMLAASGVHPKTAQKLMRHSDINLILSRYTHVFRGQETKAINAFPDLDISVHMQQAKTA